jgi:hypothetical protein
MKQIYLDRLKLNVADYKRRTALVTDATTFINEDVIVYDKQGNPQILYMKLTGDTSALRWAVKSQKYSTAKRARGLLSTSAVFGYSPRVPFKHDYCTTTKMAEDYPKQHYIITNYIKEIHNIYAQYFPVEYAKHQDIVKEKIMDEWTIDDTPFTSGIVNKNNPLKYHLDSGNFKGILSNMVVMRKGVKGGHLVIPEYDLILECADNTLVIFNGQELVHGVSPIEYEDDNSYRYSIVYYSLEQMWKCEPIGEEIKRIRVRKTIREKNRINPDHIKQLSDNLDGYKKSKDSELDNFKEVKDRIIEARNNNE